MWCSSCKNTFVGAGNLQMILYKFWSDPVWGDPVLQDPVVCIVLISYEAEAYNLTSW